MSETQAKYHSPNLPAERAMEYDVSGQTVRLTPAMVRQYLVTGKNELVTDQEVIFFMHICRARGLNPFNKDCYLVKYTQDPAAIIVSIDKLRYQARKSADCVGWKSGVIVQAKSGELRYSNGLILDGEKLLGGWFEGKPKGWEEPFKLEVNLNGYVKKTREGSPTRFWQPENQPTMIAKVAEAQGLRRLWPEQIQGLYVQEEIASGLHDEPPIDVGRDAAGPAAWSSAILDGIGSDILSEMFARFVSITADKNNSSRDELVTAANSNAEAFCSTYHAWKQKQTEGPPAPDGGHPPKHSRRRSKPSSGDTAPGTPEQPQAQPPDAAAEEANIQKMFASAEYLTLQDLHRTDRALYEEAKQSVLDGAGPRSVAECAALVKYIEEQMR
jgi:phage recombination protein Bet